MNLRAWGSPVGSLHRDVSKQQQQLGLLYYDFELPIIVTTPRSLKYEALTRDQTVAGGTVHGGFEAV